MYAAAGEAASRIADTSYEDVVLDKVIYPLGMKDSGFTLAEMMRRPNHALPYHCKSFEAAQKGETYRLVVDGIPESLIPAGDIYSNVFDMARWARAVMHEGCLDGQQVLHKETVEKMTAAWNLVNRKPSSTDAGIVAYGLGWGIMHYKGRQTWTHRTFANQTMFIEAFFVVMKVINASSFYCSFISRGRQSWLSLQH